MNQVLNQMHDNFDRDLIMKAGIVKKKCSHVGHKHIFTILDIQSDKYFRISNLKKTRSCIRIENKQQRLFYFDR